MRRTLARQHEGGRRADRPQIPRPEDPAAADRRAARHLRLDGGIHAAVPAFPACGDRCAEARALLPVRHPAHQHHPRAQAPRTPTRRSPRCSASVADWSGGTRIATSLHAFNKQWARRVLGQGAIVLLITDGLERDPDDRLAFEIDRLHRSCRRLIWLNPLLRFEGFAARRPAASRRCCRMSTNSARCTICAAWQSCAGRCRARRQGDPTAWLRRWRESRAAWRIPRYGCALA